MFRLSKLSFLIAVVVFFCSIFINAKSTLAAGDIIIDINPLETNNPSPGLSGNVSDIEASVSITVEGMTFEAIVSPDGTWSVSGGDIPNLAPGTYDVQAYAENPETSLWGADDTTDELTIIDNSTEDPELYFPEINQDNVSLIPVTGKAEANSMINVSVTDGYHNPVEQTIFTDWEGNIIDNMNFATLWDGTLKISYFAIDAYGNVSNTVEHEVEKHSAILGDAAVNTSSIINENSADSTRLSGQSLPDSTIVYYFTDAAGSRAEGEIIADSEGKFMQDIDLSSLSDGNIILAVGEINGFEQSELQFKSLTKDTAGPEVPEVNAGIINGNNINSYEVFGITEPNGIIHYAFTQDSLSESGSAFADEITGVYNFTADLSSFLNGKITLTIYSIDRALNIGNAAILDLTMNTEKPLSPEVAYNGVEINSSNAADYYLYGTALPGLIIIATFTDGNITREVSTEVLEDGTFRLECDFTDFQNGQIGVSVVGTDAFGNTSDPVEGSLVKNTTVSVDPNANNQIVLNTGGLTGLLSAPTALASTSSSTAGNRLPNSGPDFALLILTLIAAFFTIKRLFKIR